MVKAPLHIVLLGPPGSGKGTQAQSLVERLSLTQIASGDLFRIHLKNNTNLGQTAKIYLDRGELVPDDLTIQMVMDRLEAPDCLTGVIFDGFPRTVNQAHVLDTALADQKKQINLVISIAVSNEIIVERLSNRWICPVDNRVYNTSTNPPMVAGVCDKEGAILYQRSDDQPHTVRNRLKIYAEKTKPLIDYYQERDLLVEVNGNRPIGEMTQVIEEIITEQTA